MSGSGMRGPSVGGARGVLLALWLEGKHSGVGWFLSWVWALVLILDFAFAFRLCRSILVGPWLGFGLEFGFTFGFGPRVWLRLGYWIFSTG